MSLELFRAAYLCFLTTHAINYEISGVALLYRPSGLIYSISLAYVPGSVWPDPEFSNYAQLKSFTQAAKIPNFVYHTTYLLEFEKDSSKHKRLQVWYTMG